MTINKQLVLDKLAQLASEIQALEETAPGASGTTDTSHIEKADHTADMQANRDAAVAHNQVDPKSALSQKALG